MRKLTALAALLALLLTGCGLGEHPLGTTAATTVPETTLSASGETLSVHFIDVGQADCALLECGGEYMLIDGGNVEDGSLVVSFLEKQGVEELSAVVCTHAHEDHVGGLPAVLAVYPTGSVYAPTRTYSSNCFDDFMYYVDQQGLTVNIPAPGDSFALGEATVTVLGPTKSYADTNNTSIVLMVQFGATRFLFTGDMEKSAETDMLDYWGDSYDWNIDVLKVGHHGSDTSTGYRLLYALDPEYAVISVGEGNSYGHPCQETLDLLSDAGVPVFRTDKLGTVLAVSDGQEITITWEDQNAIPENVEQADTTYIGNTNSKKFHLPTCGSLPGENNRIVFESYEDAIEAGYTPCSRCLG